MKLAGRIQRVLAGHSPVALVHAVTADGHELKLEVPASDVVGVGAGDILVVDWFTFHLDDAVMEPPLITETPASDEPPSTAAASTPEETTPVASVRRMLGLPT